MKKYQIIGFIGAMVLLLSMLTPLAYVNEGFITLAPVFDNMNLGPDIWVWRDISTFAVTTFLLVFVALFFVIKKNALGTLIIGTVILIDLFFALVGVWMSSLNAEEFADVSFRFSYGWIVAIIGTGLLLYSGAKFRKKGEL